MKWYPTADIICGLESTRESCFRNGVYIVLAFRLFIKSDFKELL